MYSVILGVAYIALGILEVMAGFFSLLGLNGELIPGTEWVPIDLFGGGSAMVIGFTYVGALSLWKGRDESISYILVGSFLSAVFGGLYLLILGADAVSLLLASERLKLIGEIRPEIFLFLLSLPLGLKALRLIKAKNMKGSRSME